MVSSVFTERQLRGGKERALKAARGCRRSDVPSGKITGFSPRRAVWRIVSRSSAAFPAHGRMKMCAKARQGAEESPAADLLLGDGKRAARRPRGWDVEPAERGLPPSSAPDRQADNRDAQADQRQTKRGKGGEIAARTAARSDGDRLYRYASSVTTDKYAQSHAARSSPSSTPRDG